MGFINQLITGGHHPVPVVPDFISPFHLISPGSQPVLSKAAKPANPKGRSPRQDNNNELPGLVMTNIAIENCH